MNPDKVSEFDAFKSVHDALEPLDDDARSRVVKSVITLLAIDAHVQPTSEIEDEALDEPNEASAVEVSKDTKQFSTFAELHAAANPGTNSDKALVAGYWLQICEGAESFTSQSANKELMHLGHKLANITSALTALKGTKPQLVLQLKKSGSSQQARKTYKLSEAGVSRVNEMIHG